MIESDMKNMKGSLKAKLREIPCAKLCGCSFCTGEIRIARACLESKGSHCENKDCLNEACPLNRKWREEVRTDVFKMVV